MHRNFVTNLFVCLSVLDQWNVTCILKTVLHLDLEMSRCDKLPEQVISRVHIPVILLPEYSQTKTP